MKYGATIVFCLVFFASMLAQWEFWAGNWSVDDVLWTQAAEGFATGNLIGPDHGAYGYPATTILVPAGMVTALTSRPILQSLQVVMIVALSLATALASLAAYFFRPRAYLWLATAGVLLLESSFYRSSTPGSALLVPLLTTFMFLLFRAYERQKLTDYLLLAICAGVSLATRFETTAVLLVGAVLLIRFTAQKAIYAYGIAGIALLVFAALDPFLWYAPLEHLYGILMKSVLHAEGIANSSGHAFALWDALYAIPLGVFGFITAVALLFSRKVRSLPVAPFATYTAATGAILAAFFVSKHHPWWLFYPPLAPYEVLLLPLTIDAVHALAGHPRLQAITTPFGVSLILVGAFTLMKLISVLMFESGI